MTTLAIMKTRIASEMSRSDANFDAIAQRQILSAIDAYDNNRFYFNEKRTVTFPTVIGTSDYDGSTALTSADFTDLTLENVFDIDSLMTTYSGLVYKLIPEDIDVMERLIGNSSALRNNPSRYCRYGMMIRLYPIPNAIYTMRVTGHIKAPAPASDSEAGNVWMTKAEALIRYRAKRNIFMDDFEDYDNAQVMKMAEQEALSDLQRESGMRQSVDTIQPAGI